MNKCYHAPLSPCIDSERSILFRCSVCSSMGFISEQERSLLNPTRKELLALIEILLDKLKDQNIDEGIMRAKAAIGKA